MKTLLLIVLLTGWFSITFFYQLFMPRLIHYTKRYDIFRVIPAYRFFSIYPRYFILAYREHLINGELSAWKKIHFQRRQTWFSTIWNPHFFLSDVMGTFMENLIDSVEVQMPTHAKKIENTFDYQAILTYVQRRQSANCYARQFQIREGAGHFSEESDQVIFTSRFHHLSEGRA